MIGVVSTTGSPSSSSSGNMPNGQCRLQLGHILRMLGVEHPVFERGAVRPERDQHLLGVGRERVGEELEAHQPLRAPIFFAPFQLRLARLLGREVPVGTSPAGS